jgi:hypothetical protein
MEYRMKSTILGVMFMTLFTTQSLASDFSSRTVTENEIEEMTATKVLSESCPVIPKRLHLLTISYFDFEGKEHKDGQMVVLDAVAPHVLSIFKELHRKKFPIAKIGVMNHYQGEDSKAMADNNSSCFCDRPMTGSTSGHSIHAYGLAFDINPVQNPYVGIDPDTGVATYAPCESIKFANRLQSRPGKEARLGMAEEIIDICKMHGFHYWGGYWDFPIDYQHFQTSRAMGELLAAMDSEEAGSFFDDYVKNPVLFDLLEKNFADRKLSEVYVSDKDKFKAAWNQAKQ